MAGNRDVFRVKSLRLDANALYPLRENLEPHPRSKMTLRGSPFKEHFELFFRTIQNFPTEAFANGG
jgi:hypothetical protein